MLTWPTSKSKRRGTTGTGGRRILSRTVSRCDRSSNRHTGNSSPISTVVDGCSSAVPSPAGISFHRVILRLGPASQRGRGLKDELMPARSRFNLSWTLFSGRTAKAEPSVVWPDR
ncbi:hypothetical protein B296_00034601 [Ensete ventricosum]|uniref:Uncharacterized protein n=1 Tax=Ensete ventricosum TaxID=4639 RepID=A0A427A893_ENSVE|nr:hypothetical protein B296_00034601 [Ensete ventricosum]